MIKTTLIALLHQCIDMLEADTSIISEDDMVLLVDNLSKLTAEHEKELSRTEAAKALNISPKTFDRRVRNGELPRPTKKVGRFPRWTMRMLGL